jgi:hypothetical protein
LREFSRYPREYLHYPREKIKKVLWFKGFFNFFSFCNFFYLHFVIFVEFALCIFSFAFCIFSICHFVIFLGRGYVNACAFCLRAMSATVTIAFIWVRAFRASATGNKDIAEAFIVFEWGKAGVRFIVQLPLAYIAMELSFFFFFLKEAIAQLDVAATIRA